MRGNIVNGESVTIDPFPRPVWHNGNGGSFLRLALIKQELLDLLGVGDAI